MPPLIGERAVRRNRRRIGVLAALGVLNYWVAAILMTFAVVVGTALALVAEGFVEGADFDLLIDLVKGVPAFAGWLARNVFTATVAGGIALFFVIVGTLVAIVLIVGRVRKVERRTMRDTAAIPTPDHRIMGILDGLALAAGVPTPAVALVVDPAPNSFSVGRKPEATTIALTTGLLEKLNRSELEAVLAYELSRVVSFDTALSTWTSAVAGRTIELYERTSRLSVTLALAGPAVVARRLQRRVLRHQAEQRDLYAVGFTRYPPALISALEKIERDPAVVRVATPGNAALWLEYPATSESARFGLPTLAERIATLRALVLPGGTVDPSAAAATAGMHPDSVSPGGAWSRGVTTGGVAVPPPPPPPPAVADPSSPE